MLRFIYQVYQQEFKDIYVLIKETYENGEFRITYNLMVKIYRYFCNRYV